MPLDLFSTADGNAVPLRARLDAVLAALPSPDRDTLAAFETHVQTNGRVALNMLVSTAAQFLTDRHENAYDTADRISRRSGRAAADILREVLGAWHDRRLAFERSCQHSRDFRYGALNTGGLGATHYGDWCAVVSEGKWHTCQVAYLEADSLKTYLTVGLTLDEAAISAGSAPHGNRGALAALKHQTAAPAAATGQWSALLCSNNDYLEAIFLGGLVTAELESMRVAAATYDLYADFAYENLASRPSEDERNLMALFELAVRSLENAGVPLEPVHA